MPQREKVLPSLKQASSYIKKQIKQNSVFFVVVVVTSELQQYFLVDFEYIKFIDFDWHYLLALLD